MIISVIFENGTKMEIPNCSGYDVTGDGNLCIIYGKGGIKAGGLILNFHKVLYIGKNMTLKSLGYSNDYGDTEERVESERSERHEHRNKHKSKARAGRA